MIRDLELLAAGPVAVILGRVERVVAALVLDRETVERHRGRRRRRQFAHHSRPGPVIRDSGRADERGVRVGAQWLRKDLFYTIF